MNVCLRALQHTGRLAQLVERPLSMREARGSIPLVSTFLFEPKIGSRTFEKFLGVILNFNPACGPTFFTVSVCMVHTLGVRYKILIS